MEAMFEHHSDHLNQRDGERRAKVVIFGSYHSGKTSLVRALVPNPHLTEAPRDGDATTVALDLGIREHGGIKIYFFGTPGQERFDVAREVVAFGLHIGLVVSDATLGMSDFERKVHANLRANGVPCIVLANKMDLRGASSALIARQAGPDAIVIPVSAHTGQGIDALLDRVADIAHGL